MEVNIPVGEFKTHCYELLNEAQKNNNELIITRRGSAIAKIIPINEGNKKSIIGSLQAKAEIKGDIVNLIDDIKWEAENE